MRLKRLLLNIQLILQAFLSIITSFSSSQSPSTLLITYLPSTTTFFLIIHTYFPVHLWVYHKKLSLMIILKYWLTRYSRRNSVNVITRALMWNVILYYLFYIITCQYNDWNPCYEVVCNTVLSTIGRIFIYLILRMHEFFL